MTASEKTTSPSVCETLDEAAEGTERELMSQRHFTTDGGACQDGGVARFLQRGEANAVGTATLMRLTGCRSARALQKLIEAERARGVLILSTTRGGYFLPAAGSAGRDEIIRFERTLHARAIHTLRALRAARRALAQLDGQQRLEVECDG